MDSKKWLFIFAALSGAGGLACILQWLEIKPKDLLGWHMSLAIPHWLWLLFGLGLFVFSIGLSIYTLFKQSPAPAQSSGPWNRKQQRLQWANAERERLTADNASLQKELAKAQTVTAQLEAVVASSANATKQHEVEEYRTRQIRDEALTELREAKNRLTALESLFSPFQIEIIKFARELTVFSKGMGEKPEVSSASFPDTVAGQQEWATALYIKQEPWRLRFRSSYQSQFADRLKQIVNRLGAEGMQDHYLNCCVRGGIQEASEAHRLIEALISVAYRLDGLYIFPRTVYPERVLELMSEDERHRKIQEEPGFRETYERYLESKVSKRNP